VLLRRLVEENAATLGTAALGGLRIAASRISNQIFTMERYIGRLLPGLSLLNHPHSYSATLRYRPNWTSLTVSWSMRCPPTNA